MTKAPRRHRRQSRANLAGWLLCWPALLAAAWQGAITALDQFSKPGRKRSSQDPDLEPVEEPWVTPNRICLELGTMRLRDFSQSEDGSATLICAPYALHRATIADFAPQHSLVETLLGNGITRLLVTDWRSATPDMQHLSIDNYLADLNVVVDELGPPVDLIGLCQGGWLALTYAARFPQKVKCLVLAGAPVDIAAAHSRLATIVNATPMSVFEDLVRIGGGRVLGQRMLHLWGAMPNTDDEKLILQIDGELEPALRQALLRRFREWYAQTVDLPGNYYLQVVSWIYRENRLAEGTFLALGHRIDLAAINHPLFLLAGRDDDLAAVDQVFATARRVSTPARDIERIVAPCRHHSLFLGAKTLKQAWPRIARWLIDHRRLRQAA